MALSKELERLYSYRDQARQNLSNRRDRYRTAKRRVEKIQRQIAKEKARIRKEA